MTVDQLAVVLLVAGVLLLVSVTAVRLSVWTGLPSLLLYVALGLLLGEDAFGITFDDAQLTQVLGYAALVVILAEGGLTTSWGDIRGSVPVAAVLATAGSLVSVGVTAGAAWLVLDHDWRLALIAGAVVSSTDAAAVFSVLRSVPLPHRIGGVLEAEAGFNDAPVVILVVAFAGSGDGDRISVGHVVLELLQELTLGTAIGLAMGWLGAQLLRRVALTTSGLYPIAVMALAVAAYGAAATLHGSGFLAVYLAALVLGNARLPHGPATRGFVEGLAWVAQIGLFVLLGLLVTPSELGPAVLPALAIGTVLLLVARPLSVAVSTTPFGLPWREQAFLSWAGLRGGVPIVLATVPVVAGVARSQLIFDVVFVLVVVFTLVQGPTLPWVARRLGLARTGAARALAVEASPLTQIGADLLQLRVPPDSRLHGVTISELRLPAGAAVTLLVRGGASLVPLPTTMLRHGDDVLLVTTSEVRAVVEHRMQAVSSRGRLASWLGEGPPP